MYLLAGFCALAMPCAVQAGYDFDENGNAFVTGQAIIGFKPGTTLITAKSVLARYGADPNKIQFLDERTALVRFDERKDVLSFCRQMNASGWAPAVSPNHVYYFYGIPNDTHYSLQWGLKPSPATVGADFQGAWSYATGTGIRVGVLDSGIDLNGHPELLASVSGPLVPSVGNLYATMTLVNALPSGPSSFPPFVFGVGAPNDDVGHGTHVAGIIAAKTGNARGVAGAAQGAIIYPIKVGNRLGGSITDATIATGIRVACSNAVRVINLSLGGPAMSFVVTNAVEFAQTLTTGGMKGVVVVAAMGNSGDTAFFWPAVLPGVVAVGAHGPDGALASFSTRGPHITVAAPGGDGGPDSGGRADNSGQIFSTYPTYNVAIGPPLIPKPTYTNYSYMSGTSMAAPHVAAAAAMLLQRKPHLSQAQVWAQLAMFSTHTAPINTVTGRTGMITTIPDSAFDQSRGYGLLNANSLVQALQPAIGKTTGVPHVFPVKPRNHFTYPAGLTDPIDIILNASFNGLESRDVVRGNATNTFRLIVVDDRGERIPGAQVSAHLTLLSGVLSPFGFPTMTETNAVMLDNGTVAQDDLLNQDAVYGCKMFFHGSLSNCLYQVRYLVSAPGLRPNTNRVINLQVR